MTTPEQDTMATAYAAVDLGASSGRVVLGVVDRETVTLHEVHRFRNVPRDEDGVLVWDIDQLFAETMDGLARAASTSEWLGARLASIGIDSWGVDFALLDESGAIVGPVRHHRGAEDPAPVITSRGFDEPAAFAMTGVPDQAINTSFQLMSALKTSPDGELRLAFIPDLWAFLLTGRLGTEATIASTSQLMRADSDDWAPSLAAAYGIDRIELPEISVPGTIAGMTTTDINSRIGIPAPIPVYRVASHDTASAFAFAEPAERNTTVQGLISSGTWSLVGVPLTDPLTSEGALEGRFTNERGVSGSLLLRNLNGMWLVQQCIEAWSEVDSDVDLGALLEAARVCPSHPRAFDVADERLLAPGDMPDRIISISAEVGRPLDGSRASIIRAILDSLASAYATTLNSAAELTGCRLADIRIVGGGARNELLCRLTAEATGLTVIAGPVEASGIGNIALQIVTAGVRPSIAQVYADLSGPGTETTAYEPSSVSTSLSTSTERPS